jgi:hypothetical protein
MKDKQSLEDCPGRQVQAYISYLTHGSVHVERMMDKDKY